MSEESSEKRKMTSVASTFVVFRVIRSGEVWCSHLVCQPAFRQENFHPKHVNGKVDQIANALLSRLGAPPHRRRRGVFSRSARFSKKKGLTARRAG
jgi:hypothetical protein